MIILNYPNVHACRHIRTRVFTAIIMLLELKIHKSIFITFSEFLEVCILNHYVVIIMFIQEPRALYNYIGFFRATVMAFNFA